jgi:hypothetical protein
MVRTLPSCCVVLCIFFVFYVFLCCMYCLFFDVPCIVCLYMCTEQLPPGGYPIAVKYIISYAFTLCTWTLTFFTLICIVVCVGYYIKRVLPQTFPIATSACLGLPLGLSKHSITWSSGLLPTRTVEKRQLKATHETLHKHKRSDERQLFTDLG